jgi:DDE superfamily endonuclease
VEIHFLPPNTTAHLQPLDAGIIRAFKGRYKAQLVAHVIDQFDAHKIVNFKVDLACAFRFTKTAWSQVTAETIANCWHATGIMPTTAEPDMQGGPVDDPVTMVSECLEKLRDVIPNIMTAEEYLAVDACVGAQPLLTDEEIIAQAAQDDAAMSDPQGSEGDSEDLQGPAPPSISGARARTAVDDLLTWAEQNAGTLSDAEKHHEALLAFSDAIRKLVIRNAPQRRITEYFSPQVYNPRFESML